LERGVGGDCPVEDGGECVVVDLAEEDEAAAAEDGVVDGEGGILGGGTDQSDGALLHVHEESVLLRLAPAVNLVHKEDRAHIAQAQRIGSAAELLPQLAHATLGGREAAEETLRRGGNAGGERGLAATRRAPEQQRGEPVLAERLPQHRVKRLALPEQVVEARWTHALGEWLG